jgi:hypothetical protein
MFKQWGARYLAFARRRFTEQSRGGGEWPDLAPATKKARRGGGRRKTRSKRARTKTTSRGTGRKFAILKDTGTLFNALTIGAPGNLFRRVNGGIRVGFGGPATHPDGDATIRDIAVFHDQGDGVPKRQIIVPPDRPTQIGMQGDTQRAVQRLGRQSEVRHMQHRGWRLRFAPVTRSPSR